MSTDLIVLFDVNRADVDLAWLSARLSENPPVFADVIERYRHWWRPQAWTTETDSRDHSKLYGPGGFAFSLRPQVLQAYHMIRFSTFACDEELRTPLRRVWRFVADLVDSPRAIYTHEMMPYDGATLLEAEATLRSEIGPPADGFNELCNAEHFGPRAWCIDDFVDMRREQ